MLGILLRIYNLICNNLFYKESQFKRLFMQSHRSKFDQKNKFKSIKLIIIIRI